MSTDNAGRFEMTDADLERVIDLAAERATGRLVETIDLTVRAAIAEALPACPGGKDREKRLRVVEEKMTGHLALVESGDKTRMGFWWPLAVLVIGQLIITLATFWTKSK